MRRLLIASTAFLLTQLFVVGLAWLAGYDFDHRSPLIAEAAFYSVFIGIGAAAFAAATWGSP